MTASTVCPPSSSHEASRIFAPFYSLSYACRGAISLCLWLPRKKCNGILHTFMYDIVKHTFLLVWRILQLKTGGQKITRQTCSISNSSVWSALFSKGYTCKQGAKASIFFILQSICVLLHLVLHHMRTHKRYTMRNERMSNDDTLIVEDIFAVYRIRQLGLAGSFLWLRMAQYNKVNNAADEQ